MSRQIAVRLPDDILEFIDQRVTQGAARSRENVAAGRARLCRRFAVSKCWRSPRGMQRFSPPLVVIPTWTVWPSTPHAYHGRLGVMRPIDTVRPDKARPVLILTCEAVRPNLVRVTVAPITSSVRRLSTEVHVGTAQGLAHDSVVSYDNIVSVPVSAVGRRLGCPLASYADEVRVAGDEAYETRDPLAVSVVPADLLR